MSIVAQSPSHRGEIAELFIRDAASLLLCSSRACNALYALATLSLRPHYDQSASTAIVLFKHSHSWRFCHASATGQLPAWFKCSPKVGGAFLDSRTHSERFHSHVIEE